MQTYLLSKLVTAKPMMFSEWLEEQGDPVPDDFDDREGMYVLENAGTTRVMEMWIPLDIFLEDYTLFTPH